MGEKNASASYSHHLIYNEIIPTFIDIKDKLQANNWIFSSRYDIISLLLLKILILLVYQYLLIGNKYIFHSNQHIYPSALSCNSLADFFTSKNKLLTSSIYSLVISVFPFVFANTHDGVSSCTQYRKLVVDPISPKNAKAYGDSLMLSVDALIARIFMSSSKP